MNALARYNARQSSIFINLQLGNFHTFVKSILSWLRQNYGMMPVIPVYYSCFKRFPLACRHWACDHDDVNDLKMDYSLCITYMYYHDYV